MYLGFVPCTVNVTKGDLFYTCAFCFPAESLKVTLSSKACLPSSYASDSDTDSVFPVSPAPLVEPLSDSSEASTEISTASDNSWTQGLVPANLQKADTNGTDFKVQDTFWYIICI